MITQRVQHHGYEAHFEVQRFQFGGWGAVGAKWACPHAYESITRFSVYPLFGQCVPPFSPLVLPFAYSLFAQ